MILDFLISKIFNLPNNSSIIVYQGGLGNQLFQYLLGEELRKTYKKKVFYYDMRDSYSNNHYSQVSNIFDLEIKKYIPSRKNFLVRRIILSPKFLKIMRFFFVRFSIKIISNLFTENIYKNIDLEEVNKKQKLTIFFGTWHGLINRYKIDIDEVCPHGVSAALCDALKSSTGLRPPASEDTSEQWTRVSVTIACMAKTFLHVFSLCFLCLGTFRE